MTDGGLEVGLEGFDRPAVFSWRWLRDHGEDEGSRDPVTLQRRVDTFAIAPDVGATATVDESRVVVDWPDGVATVHSHRLLEEVAREFLITDWSQPFDRRPRLPGDVVLWSDPARGPDEVDLGRFLDAGGGGGTGGGGDDAALAHGVEQLWRYGYLVLRGDDPDPARATAFAQRLGYVRHTIFGGMWDLAPDLTDHADTAYTAIYLGPHTDATYSHDAPGMQFFLCLQPAASGGESILVDGFAVAADLAAGDPEAYTTLASVPVPGRYIEPGVHLRAERPVIRSTARGVVDQVSFNNYDRAPFLLPPELEDRFYRAYGRFAQMANDPSRRATVSLTAGDVLIFDNWRALHGRNAFTGHRHYVGAYLNHEDLESKRRVLAPA